MEITQRQIEIISHSLGVKWCNAINSQNPKDKELPKEYYRNYFFTSKGSKDYNDLELLYQSEYCKKSQRNNGFYYFMTGKAISLFEEQFKIQITDRYKKPNKSKMNYLDYLQSDCERSFSDHLNIILPSLEQCYRKGYRFVSNKYYSVCGDWEINIIKAKKSYKRSLNDMLKRPDRKDFIIKN